MNIDALYVQACQGDPTAEKELYQKLSAKFRLFAQRKVWNDDDAEEIVQEALVTVFESYRDIEIESSFAGWAHTVLQFKILSYIKSRIRQAGRNVPLDNPGVYEGTWEPDPDLKLRLEDCFRQVAKANMRYARILNLLHQGFKMAEISDKLDTNSPQIYVVLHRARSMLKGCLEKGKVGK